MTRKVPRVDYNDSVLSACKVILDNNSTGAVVFQADRAVGMLTERSLLRRFVSLDRKASEVRVNEIMAPILKIDQDASTVEAAKRLVDVTFTRLGVFEGDKFVGWVTLTDLARGMTKRRLIRAMLRSYEPEEVLCPVCKVGMMEKRTDPNGIVIRWDCTNCGYSM